MRLLALLIAVALTVASVVWYSEMWYNYNDNTLLPASSNTTASATNVSQAVTSYKCQCEDLLDQYYRAMGELSQIRSNLTRLEYYYGLALRYLLWLNESNTKLVAELKRRVNLEEGLAWALNDSYVESVGAEIYVELGGGDLRSFASKLYKRLSGFNYVDDQPSPLPVVVCSRTVVTDGPQLPPPLNGSFCNITLVYVDVNIKPPDWVVAHRQGNCRDLAAMAYVVLEYAARAAGLRNAVYFAAVWFNDTSVGHAAAFFYYGGLLTIVDPAGKYLTPDRGRPPGQELYAYNAHWGGRIAKLTFYRVEGGQLRVVANGTVAEVATALSAVKN